MDQSEPLHAVQLLTRPAAAAAAAAAGEVEAQLAEVQPLIDAARAAVGCIKADHINEVIWLCGPVWMLVHGQRLLECLAAALHMLLMLTAVLVLPCLANLHAGAQPAHGA